MRIPDASEARRAELECQRDYATRQFEWFRTLAAIRTVEGNLTAANSFAQHMIECNDTIDRLNRQLKGI